MGAEDPSSESGLKEPKMLSMWSFDMYSPRTDELLSICITIPSITQGHKA